MGLPSGDGERKLTESAEHREMVQTAEIGLLLLQLITLSVTCADPTSQTDAKESH